MEAAKISDQTKTLEELRYLIAAKQGYHNRGALPCSQLPDGLPIGAITQIYGFGKTEAAVQIIKDNPGLKAAWIEPEFELNPLAIAQRDVDLTRLLFAEAGEHLVWACHQILKSQLFPIVVLKDAPMEDMLLRKLQLATEKAQASLIILTEEFSSSWPVSLVVKTKRTENKEVELNVLRRRI
jgi:hypothetical protein